MNYGVLAICILAALAVIGLIVGLVKGFCKVSSWCNEFVVAALGVLLVDYIMGDGVDTLVGAIVIFACAVGFILIMMLVSQSFRMGFARGVRRHKTKEGYLQYEDIRDNTENILDALDEGDEVAYDSLSKREFKTGGGFWGGCDRVFGGITLAVKYFCVGAIILSVAMVIIDVAGFSFETEYLGTLFDDTWWAFFKPYIFDFIVVGLVYACMRRGYRSGLVSALWRVLLVVLVLGSFVLAWYVVFETEALSGVCESLSVNAISSWFESLDEDLSLFISEIIVCAAIAILLIIVIAILDVFVPRGIDAASDTKVFRFVDGILGAIVGFAIIFAILIAVGDVMQSMYGLDFMENFDSFFETSAIAKYIYGENVLVEAMDGFILDIGQYLVPVGENLEKVVEETEEIVEEAQKFATAFAAMA